MRYWCYYPIERGWREIPKVAYDESLEALKFWMDRDGTIPLSLEGMQFTARQPDWEPPPEHRLPNYRLSDQEREA